MSEIGWLTVVRHAVRDWLKADPPADAVATAPNILYAPTKAFDPLIAAGRRIEVVSADVGANVGVYDVAEFVDSNSVRLSRPWHTPASDVTFKLESKPVHYVRKRNGRLFWGSEENRPGKLSADLFPMLELRPIDFGGKQANSHQFQVSQRLEINLGTFGPLLDHLEYFYGIVQDRLLLGRKSNFGLVENDAGVQLAEILLKEQAVSYRDIVEETVDGPVATGSYHACRIVLEVGVRRYDQAFA